MTALSITFHSTESIKEKWEIFRQKELTELIENFLDVEHYLLSKVRSEMIQEGENTNLFLLFESEMKKQEFFESELTNLVERVETRFPSEVMTFVTHLDPIKMRI